MGFLVAKWTMSIDGVTRYIRLTNDRPSQQGWIFSRVPLTATNWQVRFEDVLEFGYVELTRL